MVTLRPRERTEFQTSRAGSSGAQAESSAGLVLRHRRTSPAERARACGRAAPPGPAASPHAHPSRIPALSDSQRRGDAAGRGCAAGKVSACRRAEPVRAHAQGLGPHRARLIRAGPGRPGCMLGGTPRTGAAARRRHARVRARARTGPCSRARSAGPPRHHDSTICPVGWVGRGAWCAPCTHGIPDVNGNTGCDQTGLLRRVARPAGPPARSVRTAARDGGRAAEQGPADAVRVFSHPRFGWTRIDSDSGHARPHGTGAASAVSTPSPPA